MPYNGPLSSDYISPHFLLTPIASLTYCFPKILSWVYSSATNNNWFWFVLTASFTITHNHDQLQELTISLQLNPSSLTAEDPLHSHSCSMAHSNSTMLTLISSRHGPRTENTALLLLRACLLGFPCDHYPASPLVCWRLPSNRLGANYIENTAPVLLAACLFACVYLATGFSGSIA
jgi:hypothetical protein